MFRAPAPGPKQPVKRPPFRRASPADIVSMASSTRKVYMLLIVVLLCFGLMVVIVSHVAPVQQLNHHVAVHIKQDVDTLMRQYRNEEIQYHLHHMPPMKR